MKNELPHPEERVVDARLEGRVFFRGRGLLMTREDNEKRAASS